MCKDHVWKWPFAAHRAEACSASIWLIASWLYTRIGYPDGTQVVTAWSPNGYQVLFAWDSLHVQLVSSGVHYINIWKRHELSEFLPIVLIPVFMFLGVRLFLGTCKLEWDPFLCSNSHAMLWWVSKRVLSISYIMTSLRPKTRVSGISWHAEWLVPK